MNIRKMTISDGMNLFLIEQRYFADSRRLSTVLIDYLYDTRFSFVCEHESTIAGFITAEESREVITIHMICVIKEYANQGITKRLLSRCIGEIREKCRNKAIQLMVNKENLKTVKIYENMGFKAIQIEHEAYFDGSDGIIMEYKDDFKMNSSI